MLHLSRLSAVALTLDRNMVLISEYMLSGGDQYVQTFALSRGNLGSYRCWTDLDYWHFHTKLLWVFVQNKLGGECVLVVKCVSDEIMLVLHFSKDENEKSVWSYTFHYTFYFLFIQPWRVVTSTYPKLESHLASDTSQNYKKMISVQDDQLIILKCLCSCWIQTSLKRSVVSHFACTFNYCSVGNKPQNILSNQVPFCRSDKHGVTSFLLSIRSKLRIWKSSKSCCPLGTPAVTSFCLAI